MQAIEMRFFRVIIPDFDYNTTSEILNIFGLHEGSIMAPCATNDGAWDKIKPLMNSDGLICGVLADFADQDSVRGRARKYATKGYLTPTEVRQRQQQYIKNVVPWPAWEKYWKRFEAFEGEGNLVFKVVDRIDEKEATP